MDDKDNCAARPRFALEPFDAPWWARGPHMQTIVGRFLRRPVRQLAVRERVDLPDGDFVDLDFTEPTAQGGREPLALVLHGLEGGSSSSYVLHTLAELSARGIRGVAMNFRSCSGEMNRSPRFYHAGDTGDLEFVLQRLHAAHPEVAIGVIGFSLGANVLLKWLGERGEPARALVGAAVAVSVPFDLAAGAANLERRAGRIYARHFMRKLARKALAKGDQLAATCDLDRVAAARTLREFDDAATAPLHGFRDVSHYYEQSSSSRYLAGIRVPTLIVHSLDDPFLPARCVPARAIHDNPQLVSAVTERGGHVGFVAGPPWAPRFWAERQAARFLASHLGPLR